MTTETATNENLRVWVGCLACYNDGRLLGRWVDAIDAGDLTSADIHQDAIEPSFTVDDNGTVHDGIYGFHEELWCMDVDDPTGLFLSGEMSPCEASRIAEGADRLEGEGIDAAAFAAFLSNEGETFATADDTHLDRFQDAYSGEYDSEEDYAQELAADLGYDAGVTWPAYCIDWTAAARDLFLGDYWSTSTSAHTVYVFRSL